MAASAGLGEVTVKLGFEWDEEKATENYHKHKVSFEEGVTVFSDPLSLTMEDPDHSRDEQRYLDVGTSEEGHVLVVSYTERDGHIRVISCRKASRKERRHYEESNN